MDASRFGSSVLKPYVQAIDPLVGRDFNRDAWLCGTRFRAECVLCGGYGRFARPRPRERVNYAERWRLSLHLSGRFSRFIVAPFVSDQIFSARISLMLTLTSPRAFATIEQPLSYLPFLRDCVFRVARQPVMSTTRQRHLR